MGIGDIPSFLPNAVPLTCSAVLFRCHSNRTILGPPPPTIPAHSKVPHPFLHPVSFLPKTTTAAQDTSACCIVLCSTAQLFGFGFLFSETESRSIDLAEPQTHNIVQANLKRKVILPWLPKCWDYRHEALFPSPILTFTVVEMVRHSELSNIVAVSQMRL